MAYVKRKRSPAVVIALIVVGAALYGVGCFATMNIVIGTITFRPAAFISCLWGILFGPWVGGLAAAIGNTFISDVLSGWFGIGGLGGFVGNFLMAFIPGMFVRNPKKTSQVIFWSIIGTLLCGICIGGWQQIMNINKFWVMTIAIWACNLPINIILTPIATKLLLPRTIKRGLYWRILPDEKAAEGAEPAPAEPTPSEPGK